MKGVRCSYRIRTAYTSLDRHISSRVSRRRTLHCLMPWQLTHCVAAIHLRHWLLRVGRLYEWRSLRVRRLDGCILGRRRVVCIHALLLAWPNDGCDRCLLVLPSLVHEPEDKRGEESESRECHTYANASLGAC